MTYFSPIHSVWKCVVLPTFGKKPLKGILVPPLWTVPWEINNSHAELIFCQAKLVWKCCWLHMWADIGTLRVARRFFRRLVVLTLWVTGVVVSHLTLLGVSVRREGSLLFLLDGIDYKGGDGRKWHTGRGLAQFLWNFCAGREEAEQGGVYRWYGTPVGVGWAVVLMNDSRCVCVCLRACMWYREGNWFILSH